MLSRPPTSDSQYFTNMIRPNTCNSTARPSTTPDPLLLKNPRLDIYPSVRQHKPYGEIKHSSNLGPGSYEYHDYSNRCFVFVYIMFRDVFSRRPQTTTRTGFTISRSNIHPDHSIIRRSAAPPIGTYNVDLNSFF